MNRFRSLVVLSMLVVAFTAYAMAGAAAKPEQQNTASPLDQHMQMLTAKLDLTVDQQAKIKPIIQQMLDSRQKLIADKNLSDDERHEKMRAIHEQADHDARHYLTDDQKKRLDELESENQRTN